MTDTTTADKVAFLPPSSTSTVEQALASALNQAHFLSEVLIIGWDHDRELFVRTSRMSRRDALWLCEQAKIRTLDIANYQDDPG